MGNEPWCEVGDMPVAWCAHCRGVISPEEETEQEFDAMLDRWGNA